MDEDTSVEAESGVTIDILAVIEIAQVHAIAALYDTTASAVCRKLLSLALDTPSLVRKAYPMAVDNKYIPVESILRTINDSRAQKPK